MLGLKLANRILPFLFLFIVIMIGCRFLFFTSYIHFKKTEFRKTILNNSDKDVVSFSINSAQLYKDINGREWKENNKELVINGLFHEVLAVKIIGKSAMIYLIQDQTENKLFHDFFSSQQGASSDALNTFIGLLNILFIETNFSKFCSQFSTFTHSFKVQLKTPLLGFVLKHIKPPQLA